MESYEQLLDYAYNKIKTSSSNSERFDVPKPIVQNIGNKTVISNFSQISTHIRRKQEDIIKFLSKELAAFCKPEGERLILNRKIPEQRIIEKINLYVNKFVLCKECKKPDTEILKEHNFSFMRCLACGAKHSLGNI